MPEDRRDPAHKSGRRVRPGACDTLCGEAYVTPEDEVMIHRLPKTPPGLDLRDELETDWRPVEVW